MALSVSSPAFTDGGRIPDRFGYEEQNVNPQLDLSGVPEDAATLAVVVDDPDAQQVADIIWDHWVVWNIPPDQRVIPEGWDPSNADAVEGQNDYGEQAYGGPNPPKEVHEYRFQVYALDTEFGLPETAGADALRAAMKGHVLDEAEITGRYGP